MNELEQYKDIIEKHKEEIREIEAHFRKHGNDQVSYSIEQLKMLVEFGYIPKELGEWEIKRVEETETRLKEMHEFKKNHPDMSQDEFLKHFFKERTLSPEETVKFYEDAAKSGNLLKCLFENKELLQPGALDDLPNKFFRSLQAGEFGISRLVSDPLNQVPELLKNPTYPELITDDIYLLKWECDNSCGDKIRLEFRFRAPNQEEADKQAQAFIKRLMGKQKKVFEACWAMANKKMRRTYTCDLTDLMEIAYPMRKNGAPFSVKERVEFYQDLLDLSQTQFKVYKNKEKKTKIKQKEYFILPFITIHKGSESESNKESEKYPNQISLSVLHNPLYEDEKMYNVGAGIKYSTLELHSDDMKLAEWIQIRKNQQMDESHLTLDRDFLIRLANLEGIKHSGMANKRLIEKLGRLKDKGIILGHPRTITPNIRIKIR
jgi:hypothetical protein